MASGRDSQTSDKPMDETLRNIIRTRRVELARDMEPRQLIHHMVDVLTPRDEEEIQAVATRWGQCEKLLDILPRRGQKAFDSFVKALKEVQPFLAGLLVDAEMKPRTEEESNAQCQSVPEEIILRGRSARQVFNKALLEGTKQLKRVPIMIVGQGRSGKTSLKKSLKGEPYDPEENSTVMMEVDPSYCKVTTEVWKIVRQNQAVDSGNSSRTVQDVSDVAQLIEMLQQALGKDEDNEETYATLWDFGGQSVYYATSSLFLTRNAIYFLVYNLSRNPDDKAIPSVRQGLFTVVQDTFSNTTNMHYLDYWMSSISCFASQDEGPQLRPTSQKLPQKLPPVFLVCTHADKPYNRESPKELACKIYGSLVEKMSGLHLFEDFFVVDNTKAGTADECPDIPRLRTEVLAVAKEIPHVNQSFPKKWFKFEEALEIMRERGLKWIPIDEARKVALEVCNIVNDEEFGTLMTLLHDQRILIHFSDTSALNKMAILNLQWLIDVFRKVITIAPYEGRERGFKELWCKLETTGILEESLLEHIWSPTEREASESLLAIMERFSLLCPWPSSVAGKPREYLVPSMLMSPPPDDVMQLIASLKMPSLFLKFESGQVPPSLFPRLVVQFFQWVTEKWPGQQQPHLFLNFARFYTHPADEYSVILVCHTSSIEVAVHRAQLSSDSHNEGFDVKITRDVCNRLRLMLEVMSQELIWMRNMQFEMSVLCPVCCPTAGTTEACKSHQTKGCRQEKCLHFLSESELHSRKPVICNPAFAPTSTVHVSLFNHWFQLLDEENPSANLVGRPRTPVEEVEESALALPDKVLRSLLSRNIEAYEVIARLLEIPPLERELLVNPQPGTKRFVRNLATVAKEMNRYDVFEHLRGMTPAGTTGPKLPEYLDVRDLPFSIFRDVTVSLSGGDEWMLVAQELGLTTAELRFLDKRSLNPFEAALRIAGVRVPHLTVGGLYDVLIRCGFPVIADLL